MQCPAALPAIALAAGIAAGIFLPVFVALNRTIFTLCFLASIFTFIRREERATTVFLACGFLFGGALLGARAHLEAVTAPLGVLFDQHRTSLDHQLLAVIDGRLRTDAARGPSGVSLIIDVEAIELNNHTHRTSGGVIVAVGGELASAQISEWRNGRRLRLPAILRRPTQYLDPGVPDMPRQFAWRGVTLVGSTKSDRLVELVARGSSVTEIAGAIRAQVRRSIAASVAPWSARSAAVVSAILIGDRAGLEDDVERRLQEAGTYHVIAISGGNIAIFAGVCLFMLRGLRLRARMSGVIIILLLSTYALIVEGGSSVGRATLMAAIYFSAQIGDHRARATNAAASSALILCLVDPLQIVDAGFVLTFGATLGILVGIPHLFNADATPKWLQPVFALLLASACAEIALLPVSAFVFSRVTAAGLIVNFAAIPLMTIVQIAGTAAVALDALGISVSIWAGWIAHWAVEGLIESASLVDIVPWLTRRVPPPSMALIALYYGALVVVLMAVARKSTRRAAIWAAVVIGCGMWIVFAPIVLLEKPARPLRVTFIDVGQGDAAIVQFPDGRTLSVDAGGLAGTTFDIGGRVVSPTFWAMGVRRLDYMSISHGDPDHIGGAASVFRDFHPIEVWEGVPVPPHKPTRQLRQLANSATTPWRTLQTGDRVQFGDVELTVHHPPRPDWERQRVRNDDSEVLEIRYGGVSFVFTGDIGMQVERSIAPAFERVPIRIVKVPHHGSGSSSSSEFLDALHPAIAVISCGRGNPFGHPVASVLERYRSIGAAIYRTDQDGAVTVETDGETVRVRTFTNRRLTLRARGR
jgi:competence protein ComEC